MVEYMFCKYVVLVRIYLSVKFNNVNASNG